MSIVFDPRSGPCGHCDWCMSGSDRCRNELMPMAGWKRGVMRHRTNGDGRPVVSLDIDGTLGDYQTNFLTFARSYFGRAPREWTTENPGMPMWEWMGIPQHEYREAKLAYRQGGWKRWMPVYPGALELTHAIRSAGAEVWLCTTRPYLRLDNVDPDTREWLRRNGMQYDAVLFDRIEAKGSKYRELWAQAGHRVACVIDDLPEMVEEAARIWSADRVILRDQPYNQHFPWPRRAFDLQSMRQAVLTDIKLWEQSQ